MKFSILVADPPFGFSDKLTMSSVKRGAEANYKSVLTIDELKKLSISEISEDNALLALWVPSSLLQEGLDIMKAWGFRQKQTFVWVKSKKNWLQKLTLRLLSKKDNDDSELSLNNSLAFGMGHYFRQAHEVCLIGIKGKMAYRIENKSQRSVHFHEIMKHSKKPEAIQDRLEIMFPNNLNRLELFARRDKPGWFCLGNECPSTKDEDIRDAIKRLIKQ